MCILDDNKNIVNVKSIDMKKEIMMFAKHGMKHMEYHM